MWRSEKLDPSKNWCKIEMKLTLVFDRAVGKDSGSGQEFDR